MSKPFRLFILLALSSALLVGCGDDQAEQIEWQLPLVAPSDSHGTQAQRNSELPEWAVLGEGSAKVVLLQKSTTRLFDAPVEMNGTVEVNEWEVRLLGLAEGLRMQSGAFIEDRNVHNPAAFVELVRDGSVVYRGWLYQEFPELFGPDLADWKLWIKEISVRRPPEEGTEDTTGSLSSAG